jgi:hypothetical protein
MISKVRKVFWEKVSPAVDFPSVNVTVTSSSRILSKDGRRKTQGCILVKQWSTDSHTDLILVLDRPAPPALTQTLSYHSRRDDPTAAKPEYEREPDFASDQSTPTPGRRISWAWRKTRR